MRQLRRFWKALETLPRPAAERLEWRRLLGDEWSVAEPLLRQTGALVERVWCPSPSGVDCPRRVIRHDADRIVAVCGDRPKNCDTLSLALEDIAVLELDIGRFAQALAGPLGLKPTPSWIESPTSWSLASTKWPPVGACRWCCFGPARPIRLLRPSRSSFMRWMPRSP